MKRIFVFEWKRMIRSKTLLFSAVAAALIVIADVFAWFRLYQQDVDVYTSVFHKWLGTQPAIGAGSYLHIVLPLLTAFAYKLERQLRPEYRVHCTNRYPHRAKEVFYRKIPGFVHQWGHDLCGCAGSGFYAARHLFAGILAHPR